MIYKYEIVNNNKEDILYLYISMTNEFSKEFGNKDNSKNIIEKATNYINDNNINFNGNKIYLINNGIIIKTLDLKTNETKEEIKNINYLDDNYMLNLIDNNKSITISLKKYLLGILSTNCINNLELESLKSLCILYRTYAFKEMTENNLIYVNNSFQIYKPINFYKLIWLEDYKKNYQKLEEAIDKTNGEFATYNNKYILPFIHICNNGSTDTFKNIEYLEKRSSLWDYMSPYYIEIKTFNYREISNKLNININLLKDITLLKTTKSNHIEKIKIGNKILSGKELKNLLNLRSSDISIIINPDNIKFITKGWGNNIGLSQFGANEIAKTGYSYVDILKYYFPNIQIQKYTKK